MGGPMMRPVRVAGGDTVNLRIRSDRVEAVAAGLVRAEPPAGAVVADPHDRMVPERGQTVVRDGQNVLPEVE